MNVEEAIKTAIEYETKVRDVYTNALNQTEDEDGKKIFRTLAKEEQGHLDYLNERMKHLQETGKVDSPELGTLIPTKSAIDEGIAKLEKGMERKQGGRESEIELMNKALDAEVETSKFYKKMVDELPEDGKKLFKRFLEIEQGHVAIVQAELNALSGVGFWFDFSDINLEMG